MSDQPNAPLFTAWLLHSASGDWLAASAELVGCYAPGATEAEALDGLRTAIPAFYHWLSEHDDYTPTLSGPIRVQELGSYEVGKSLDSIFLLDDNEPVNDEDLDWLLAVLGWAYDDLLRDAAQRPGSPKREALLTRVAMRQAQFIGYALGVQPPTFTGAGLEQATAAREIALHMFRESNGSQRRQVHDVEGQRWSMRSGIRASVLLARRATETLNTI